MLLELSTLAPLLPLGTGIKRRSNLLWWYCLFSLTTDLITYYLRWKLDTGNAIPGNIFALVEFSCILFYYKNKVFRKDTLFYILLTGGYLLFLFTTGYGSGWTRLNRIGICIFLISYMALALTGFYNIIKEQRTTAIEQSSFFWANTAIFIFAAGAFFMFLATANIRSKADGEALSQLWFSLFQVINILKNILLGIALFKKQDR